jgi:3-ketosteroid 9alpha-monooxygenase subunit A
VEDGVTEAWHAVFMTGRNAPPSAEDIAAQQAAQAGALEAFGTDFEIWKNKRSALKVMQLKTDGPFNMVRKWVGSFYLSREEGAALREQMKGVQPVHNFPQPPRSYQEQGFESDMYGSLS